MDAKGSERYERGWTQLSAITGEKGRSTIDELSRFSPDLCRFIVEFAYGDVYDRPGLDPKQRMTVTLATLVTLGDCDKELAVHVGSALRVGLLPAEIVEIVLHCIPYVGFPRVMNAIAAVRRVFEEKGIVYEPPSSSV